MDLLLSSIPHRRATTSAAEHRHAVCAANLPPDRGRPFCRTAAELITLLPGAAAWPFAARAQYPGKRAHRLPLILWPAGDGINE
jgi:hypothetical protein